MARSAWILVLVAACARGGSGNADDEPQKDAPATTQHDAPTSTVDAPRPIDASPPVDAMTPVDSVSSLFCTANSMCTISGECCITLGGPQGVCGPGTVILGQCVPQ